MSPSQTNLQSPIESTNEEKHEEDENDRRRGKGLLLILLLPYETCWMVTVSAVGVVEALITLFVWTLQVDEAQATAYFCKKTKKH